MWAEAGFRGRGLAHDTGRKGEDLPVRSAQSLENEPAAERLDGFAALAMMACGGPSISRPFAPHPRFRRPAVLTASP